MRKVFIFDLDGVLVNNEPLWEIEKEKIYIQLFGKEVAGKMGPTIGMNMGSIYDKTVQLGAQVQKDELIKAFYKSAQHVYRSAPLPAGLQELGSKLIEFEYSIGIVSASPREWMDLVIERLTFKDEIKNIISLHERPDLKHKPAPDGYIEAIRTLGAAPSTTIVLEDSNPGIASAKAAGAYTVCLEQNLIAGYTSKGADRYVKNLKEVVEIIKSFPL